MSRWFESHSPAETRRLAARVGRLLQAGDVVLLQGDLGSGKTVFAQGLGQGLKVREPVKSSSFVLLNEYHGRLDMYHADLYRLTEPGEVIDLGLDEVAAPGVLVIEWPERAWEELTPEHLLVRIESAGTRERRLTFEARGEQYKALLARLAARAAASAGRRGDG
jgi:tRNA threonylcarbamoyladenosine biosynthesis protein TsaE